MPGEHKATETDVHTQFDSAGGRMDSTPRQMLQLTHQGQHRTGTESDIYARLIQCRIKVGAIDSTALGPLKKQAHSHGREIVESLLDFGCEFLCLVQFRENH